jgi:hypothetical protein
MPRGRAVYKLHYPNKEREKEMISVEEIITATIRKFEQETIDRLNQASAEGQIEIQKFVTNYIAGLQVEMPLSVKQVLDRGGQVRQMQLKKNGVYPDWLNLEILCQGSGCYQKTDNINMNAPKGVRVTMIIEPLG